MGPGKKYIDSCWYSIHSIFNMSTMYLLSVAIAITHAGTSSDMSVIKNVTISPDPPKAGQQLTIDANFVLSMLLATHHTCRPLYCTDCMHGYI